MSDRRTVYSVSEQLRKAIESLFEDPSIAYGYLGLESSSLRAELREESLTSDLDPTDRAMRLRLKLEQYINQMSDESAELESDEETNRLRSEAVGVLIALREVVRHFPEVGCCAA